MQPRTLNPVELAILLAGFIFSPDIARVIGPYAVIVIAAATGSAWALGRRPKTTRASAFWFFLRMNATALLLTVSLAVLLQKAAPAWLGVPGDEWLLAPIAVVVGAVGDDWSKMGRWLVGRIGRIFDRNYGTEDTPK